MTIRHASKIGRNLTTALKQDATALRKSVTRADVLLQRLFNDDLDASNDPTGWTEYNGPLVSRNYEAWQKYHQEHRRQIKRAVQVCSQVELEEVVAQGSGTVARYRLVQSGGRSSQEHNGSGVSATRPGNWQFVEDTCNGEDATTLRGDATGLGARGIVAINIKGDGVGGPSVEREGGATQAVTEQTLTGDTRGALYNAVAGVAGILQTTEQADGTGQSVLLAVNSAPSTGRSIT